ncbi:MAG: GNAT family N-acetyltransferase [Planctomycetota bacterium]|jgi:GNAT superfamily N-acetyltransferase
MADIRIEHLEDDRLEAARKLVWRVFPQQSLPERLSFWAIVNRRSPFVHWLTAWAGVADFLDLWGAIDSETGTLLGTTGLYVCTHDATEAVWLAWFCVAPEARRQGIGSQLLDFSIAQAKRTGRQYLRLYTSDRPVEAAAQILYESRGLKIVRKKRRLFYTTIYRERPLDRGGNMATAP